MPLETFQHWVDLYGYAALYFSLVFGIVGLPIPDESILAFSGYLVFTGQFDFVLTSSVAILGSLTGISFSYGIGRVFGYGVIRKHAKFFHLTDERLLKVNGWFDRIGKWALSVGYFIPGVRHLMALVAGASNLKYPVFAAFAYTGGIVWSLTFITLGYSLGSSWSTRFHSGYRLPLAIAAAILFLAIALLIFLKRKKSRSQNQPSKEVL